MTRVLLLLLWFLLSHTRRLSALDRSNQPSRCTNSFGPFRSFCSDVLPAQKGRQVNRAQRRQHQRRQHQRRLDRMRQQIDYITDAAQRDGEPWTIYGLADACMDCHAEATITALPNGSHRADIWHDDGCPATTGITEWQPCPIDWKDRVRVNPNLSAALAAGAPSVPGLLCRNRSQARASCG